MERNFEPLISIIIPVFNAEKYIEKCVLSIFNQSYQNFELIIINDGSTDRSFEILNNLKKKRDFILINKKNSGVSDTRNTGITVASGDYICFVDSDDYIDQNYLKTFIENQEGERTLLIQDIFRGNNRKANYSSGLFNIKKEIDILINKNKLFDNGAPYAKYYNRNILIENNIKFENNITYGEDLIFFLDYLKYIDETKYIDYAGYYYAYNPTSASTKKHSAESYLAIDNAVEKFIHFFNITNNNKLLKPCYLSRWDYIQSGIDRSIDLKKNTLEEVRKKLDFNFFKFANSKFRKLIYILIKLRLYYVLLKINGQ